LKRTVRPWVGALGETLGSDDPETAPRKSRKVEGSRKSGGAGTVGATAGCSFGLGAPHGLDAVDGEGRMRMVCGGGWLLASSF